ncbi:MAG: aldolase/citrate lyase family protein [Bacteroidia bacterium]|nr:aldolase/citrate lyase family protein [Bacteroidia bacterium]
MELPRNRLKEKLQSGYVSYGIWHGMVDTYAAEICAGAGFDWVMIDGEHTPFDFRSMLIHAQVMAAHESAVFVRPPIGDPVMLKQLLDAGIQNFLIPMVESAEQAKELVAAIHYPPKGKRGVGAALGRASQWARIPDYIKTAAKELCLILQVESVKGMKELENICQLDGVDGVFIGPADLAASMGYPGEQVRDEVREEVKRGLHIIKSHNKITGVLAFSEPYIQEYTEAGANYIAICSDSLMLAESSSNMARKYVKE